MHPRPLPAEQQSRYEPYFGFSLANIRIHADDDAARRAHALSAAAFTERQSIHFGRHHDPRSRSGELLMLHELAHVGQYLADPRRRPVLRCGSAGVFGEQDFR